jgi:hypothetical protein
MSKTMEITVTREGTFCSFTKEEGGKKIFFNCQDIRGAMVWPTLTSPAYFSIFAQLSEPNAQGKLPLVLLSEGEDALPHKFFRGLIAHSKQFWCRHFYVDFQRETRELANLFTDICRYGRITHIRLIQAPFANNFIFGLGLAREWWEDAALEIPQGTILRAQLSAISSEDLAQGVEERFYAINGLRYTIGSVEKSPWKPELFTSKQGGNSRDWSVWT